MEAVLARSFGESSLDVEATPLLDRMHLVDLLDRMHLVDLDPVALDMVVVVGRIFSGSMDY
jgi:hypothetical protein